MSATHHLATAETGLESPQSNSALTDLRFQTLVGKNAWSQLPPAVQQRFSKCFAPSEVILYRGRVIETRLPLAGRIFAALTTIVGSPLPKSDGAVGPAVVSVTEEPEMGGQLWSRSYNRPGRFPQVIHSAKRFSGPTGLEEYIGYGISMSLRVSVEGEALVFRADRYFVAPLPGLRITIPKWLSPGNLEVIHREEHDGEFSFCLTLTHPLFGLLVSQLAHFKDA